MLYVDARLIQRRYSCMNDNYVWKSNIGVYLKDFLAFMRLSGYKYKVPERWLKQFDQYCIEKGVQKSELQKDIVEDFCYGDGYESVATRQDRLCLMRKLAEYMKKSGCNVYIPSVQKKSFSHPKHEPYIFRENELCNIFSQIDNWEQPHQSHTNRRLVDPLLFRMIYGCGLRVMEALCLTIKDVDIKEGILRIKQAKNGKDRFVPMADSLIRRCREYIKTMHHSSQLDSYFFPGFHSGHYVECTIYRRFRQYLWKAGISHSGKGPRIHDLRHTYCVHRLKKWVLGGKDLTNLMPYLSVYLGHSDFRGTEYYLRLTADLYPNIISQLEKSHGYIIPEREVEVN